MGYWFLLFRVEGKNCYLRHGRGRRRGGWMYARPRCRSQGWRAFPGVTVTYSRALRNRVGRVTRVRVGRGASREGCMWYTCLAKRGWRGVVKWVFRGARGVDTDLEVRVQLPSIVVEVVGLWRHSRTGDRLE